ncbi:sugar kinase [Streptomyces sp. NPDC007088]|uniref:sugar kinase n=1 Tax=Streptomyces sp. NPDC007088 TaxID=3364773 RepID=UPI0036A8184C
MIRRRSLTLLIIVLLIGVPAGYLLISAAQSRDSGRDKEDKYSATGLTAGWPSKVQRRIYEVDIPKGGVSSFVAYYETNNWRASRLYVQFRTTDKGLRKFLHTLDRSKSDLRPGVTIKKRDRDITGWSFDKGVKWTGLVHHQDDPRPTQDVTVDRTDKKYPIVYVVSDTTP